MARADLLRAVSGDAEDGGCDALVCQLTDRIDAELLDAAGISLINSLLGISRIIIVVAWPIFYTICKKAPG